MDSLRGITCQKTLLSCLAPKNLKFYVQGYYWI